MKKKYIFIGIALLFISNLANAEIEKCGLYSMKGIVMFDKELLIKALPDTYSEVKVRVSDNSSKIQLSAYVKRSVDVEFYIKSMPKTQYDITIKKIEKIDLRPANPLNANDTGITLIKEEKCF